jgi:acetyltransferase-like isoleucine patch superfamily enzyme
MRKLIKKIIFICFYVLALPAGLSSILFYKVFRYKNCFLGWGEFLSLIPGPPGIFIRGAFYKQTLKNCHSSLIIMFGSHITKMETEIEPKVIIAGHTTVGLAKIGAETAIGNHVALISGRRQHNFDDPDQGLFAVEESFERINIGNNAFIGDHCTVMADIGERALVGAGSVVVKAIPAYSMAVGNPARVIKDRRSKTD